MHRALLTLAVLGSLLVSTLALSQVRRSILNVADIRPGMRGHGLTVFRGDTPERFDVEVIDVLHKFRPDQDLILIRTEHPILERAIAVGGMSGSPIYLGDKLIGAYAYGWTFGKEPVAGVTPIANMLAEIARPIDPKIWKSLGTLPVLAKQLEAGAGHASASAAPARASGSAAAHVSERAEPAGAFSALRAHAALASQTAGSAQYGRPVQVSTPLLLSGMTERAIDVIARELAPFGLEPVQAGGGSGAPLPGKPARFSPGSSIGVQLVRGDIQVTATGTVTHIEGQRVLGFGHPMLNAGQVGLPTTTSRVIHVLSSQMRSFKLAEAREPLGTLVHDRQSAIVVDQSMRVQMLPMKIRVHGAPQAPRSEWNLELANHRLLTPGLAFSALVNALTATSSDRSDVMYRVRGRLEIAGRAAIETEDLGYTPLGAADPGSLSGLRPFELMSTVYDNPFEDASVRGLTLDVDLRFGREVTTILDAHVASDSVDPGKDVAVYVTLRAFDARERVEIVHVAVPQSAAGDSIEISVEAGDQVRLEQPKPSSLDDLLTAVRAGYPSTSLVISTKLPQSGVRLRGRLVGSLPGSVLDTLQPVNDSDRPPLFPTVLRKELPGREVLTGSAKIKLNVREEPLR